MAGALTVGQLFDTLAIRVDGPRAAGQSLVIDWNFTDGHGVRAPSGSPCPTAR